MKPTFLFTLLLSALCLPEGLRAQDRALAFAEAVAAKIQPLPTLRGDDPLWFFPMREVKHLATGRFWEQPWEEVAANRTDPLDGMIEFYQLLKERGIRLLAIPVPAKASIYPETLVSGFVAGEVAAISPFIGHLAEQGVEVLDLEPRFLAERHAHPETLLYCQQDAHFSPRAAQFIAEQIQWPRDGRPNPYRLSEATQLSIVGDQIVGSEWENAVASEILPLRYVTDHEGRAVEPDPESPILLLGDSHTLVFHEGREAGMHCRGAGVLDYLALQCGFAPDLVGVRGSGLVQARKQLFYKASSIPNYWDTKKLVIWLFSVREFTQSTDKPVPIPLTR